MKCRITITATRGVSTGPARKPQIVFGTRAAFLIHSMPKWARQVKSFATTGLDLHSDTVMPGFPKARWASPRACIYKNLINHRFRVQETPQQGASGQVRASIAHGRSLAL